MHYILDDKITTRTQSFVSDILNFAAPATKEIMQSSNQANFTINPIVLQKLLKYFNVTAISTFFLLSSSGTFPVTFTLNWNDSKSSILSFDLSL